MSKILEARCVAGVVSAMIDGIPFPVPEAVIVTAGIELSEGFLVIDEDRAFYMTANTTNIESGLQDLIDVATRLSTVCTELITAFTAFGAAMTGPTTAPPPTLSTILSGFSGDVTALTTKIAQITLLKETLK